MVYLFSLTLFITFYRVSQSHRSVSTLKNQEMLYDFHKNFGTPYDMRRSSYSDNYKTLYYDECLWPHLDIGHCELAVHPELEAGPRRAVGVEKHVRELGWESGGQGSVGTQYQLTRKNILCW